MNNIDVKIYSLIERIDELSELFYKQKSQEGYLILPDIIEKMLELIQDLIMEKNEIIEKNINELTGLLKNILKAMEEGDTVLMADILQYEMVDRLKLIKGILEENRGDF